MKNFKNHLKCGQKNCTESMKLKKTCINESNINKSLKLKEKFISRNNKIQLSLKMIYKLF